MMRNLQVAVKTIVGILLQDFESHWWRLAYSQTLAQTTSCAY
jgi:hypothetical protein